MTVSEHPAHGRGSEVTAADGHRVGGQLTTQLRWVVHLLPPVLILASLFVGRYPLSIQQVVGALADLLSGHASQSTPEAFALVVSVRLPRAIAAAAVGAALAASGAAYQSIFRNPLTDSSLLGVSNGAGFGAAFALVFLGGSWRVYVAAFAFGLLAVALTYMVANVYRLTPTIMLILGGVIVSSVFSALLSLMKFTADPESELPSIVYWLMGSLSSAGWESLWALIPMLVGTVALIALSWRIDAMSMGDREARTMGIDVRREKAVVILGATLATAAAICISGVVGWVGLVIPHISRMLAGNQNSTLIPVSVSVGAAFMLLIDAASRSLWPSEVPLGILTALIGAPFFVYLLKRTKGGSW